MTAVFAPRTFLPRVIKKPPLEKSCEEDSPLAKRLPINPHKIDSLSSFLQKYPGKILIIGPENQLTPKKISQIVKTLQKFLDQEEKLSSGIFSEGDMTLWYIKKNEPHSLWL